MRRTACYEPCLPVGFHHRYTLNFRSGRFAGIYNTLSLALLLLSLVIASLFLIDRPLSSFALSGWQFFIGYGVFFAASVLYLLLHELTHGLLYLVFTGKRPTVRIRLRGIYMGVPSVYLHSFCALVVLLCPSVILTLAFIPVLVYTFLLHPMAYLAAAFLFGIHLDGTLADCLVAYRLIKVGSGALLQYTEGEYKIYRA